MTRAKYPTDADIRAVLLWRAARFSRQTGIPPTTIARQSVNDSALFSRLVKGRNFTVATYQKVMDWLDDNWPAGASMTVPSSLQMTRKVNRDFCAGEGLTHRSS